VLCLLLGAVAAQQTIGDLLDMEEFQAFKSALDAANLTDSLDDDTYTIFAPTNDAFAKLNDTMVTLLLSEENLDQLQELLFHHVIAGNISASQFVNGTEYPTLLADNDVTVFFEGEGDDTSVFVMSAGDVEAEVVGLNGYVETGVVHAIDTVLIPLDFELIVPTTPAPISTSTDDDNDVDNDDETTMMPMANGLEALLTGDVSYTLFYDAIQATNLTDRLFQNNGLTVLIPNNQAFGFLDDDELNDLFETDLDRLRSIVLLHIIDQTMTLDALVIQEDVDTIDGVKLEFDRDVFSVEVEVEDGNEADVVEGNIQFDGGVAHEINRVLMTDSAATQAASLLLVMLAVAFSKLF